MYNYWALFSFACIWKSPRQKFPKTKKVFMHKVGRLIDIQREHFLCPLTNKDIQYKRFFSQPHCIRTNKSIQRMVFSIYSIAMQNRFLFYRTYFFSRLKSNPCDKGFDLGECKVQVTTHSTLRQKTIQNLWNRSSEIIFIGRKLIQKSFWNDDFLVLLV